MCGWTPLTTNCVLTVCRAVYADMPSKATKPALSEQAIRALIVEGSRESYYRSGKRCARPEDRNAAGHKCGGTSAYSRGGGAQIFCYPHDVPASMIEKHRAAKL
jgi:hypothetical protein